MCYTVEIACSGHVRECTVSDAYGELVSGERKHDKGERYYPG
jgi:hypothetical protein